MSKVLDLLKQTGAVITDSHFVGTSGKHFSTYINKDALYPHTRETSAVCKLFAEQVKDLQIDTVVGPMLGGIILGISESLFSGLVNSDYKDVFSFSLLVLVLVFRPQGLLGRPLVSKV